MKHLFTSAFLLLALLLPATASAYDFEVDGIYYNINGNEATVTSSPGSNQYSGDVTIPSSVSYYSTTYPVTGIGDRAFQGCSGMTSITIPNSIISIGINAFSACTGLTSISIPNSVTSIGEKAFYCSSGLKSITVDYGNPNYDSRNNCNALIETVTNKIINGCKNTIIPNSVTSIGDYAFSSCTGLTSATIPNSVTSIGVGAFQSCSGLTCITIPNSVTFIGFVAFQGCTGLTDVFSYITDLSEVSIGSSVFSLSPANYSNRTLHIPVGTLADYQDDAIWEPYFGTIVEMVPPNCFSIPDTAVFHGETITIPIQMINEESIMAFQTDIYLPEGFSIVTDEDNEPMITPSSRLTSDHVIMADQLSDGSVRVICYTPRAKVINGNEGDLFYFTVAVPEDSGGEYSILLRNSLLTTTDYEELSIPDAGAVLTVNTYIPGDVNDSRTVNVTDIVVTAQYILQRNPSPFIFEAADMNGDGNITVTDIMLIARLIMTPPTNAPKRMPAITANGDRMSGESIFLSTGETRTVTLALDNAIDYSAFQLDLNLPDGLTASNFQLTDRAGNHAFDVEGIGNSKLRVLCYSPAIDAIEGNNGALLTFDVTATCLVAGDIMVDGIEFVTTACQPVLFDAFTIGVDNVTAVNEVATSKTVARVDYFNVAGQRINRPESGVTLIVTTYTDGTRATTKHLH